MKLTLKQRREMATEALMKALNAYERALRLGAKIKSLAFDRTKQGAIFDVDVLTTNRQHRFVGRGVKSASVKRLIRNIYRFENTVKRKIAVMGDFYRNKDGTIGAFAFAGTVLKWSYGKLVYVVSLWGNAD